jgi:hypothetical protein
MGKLTTTTTQPAALALIATTPQLLASIGVNFRPELPTGVDQGQWGRSYAAAIGQHPAEVLALAGQIIIASRSYQTFPQPAEIIGAILNAYGQLGVPMSPDAVRLQDLRQSSDRYVAGADGRRRFLSGLKLGVIKFHALAGHHGNQVLDEIDIAAVAHVELAILDVSREVDKLDEIAIGDLLRRIAARADELAAFETFGSAEAQCGGPVARHGDIEFKSKWVCLSQAFIEGLIARHPTLDHDGTAWFHLHEMFPEMRCDGYMSVWRSWSPKPRTYGRGMQADFERKFSEFVAAKAPQIERRAEERKQEAARRASWKAASPKALVA